MNKICYVTAFLDLNRETWIKYERSVEHYFISFSPLIKLLKKEPDNSHLVVFIDEKYRLRIDEMISDIRPNVTVISINYTYLETHIPIWKRLDEEKQIMNSDQYKELIQHRIEHPEHNNPQYTMINHAKIDFIIKAMEFIDYPYMAWIDFGYFGGDSRRVPVHLLDINKFDLDKINYTLVHQIDDKDKDVIYTLKEAPYKVGGFFFFGHRDIIRVYQELYHSTHQELQKDGIVDDDQHIALRCYFKQPELFKMHHLGWYNRAMVYFQKDKIPTWVNQNRTPIYLVVHIGLLNPSVFELLETIKDAWVESGLWDIADKILFGAVGDECHIGEVKNILQYRGECIARDDSLIVYERPTLQALHKLSCSTEAPFHILYCHTKGVTRKVSEFPGVRKWLKYMLYFACQYYPIILKTMQDHPTTVKAIGRDRHRANEYETEHFSGNFWWSHSNHLKSLPYHIGDEYLESEMWVGSNGGLFELFYTKSVNWYHMNEDHWETGKPYDFIRMKKSHIIKKQDIPEITYFGRPGDWVPRKLNLEKKEFMINCVTMESESVPYKRMWVFFSKDGYWHAYLDEEIVKII
jgi:hypothetical protein